MDGEKTHQLTIDELAKHSHNFSNSYGDNQGTFGSIHTRVGAPTSPSGIVDYSAHVAASLYNNAAKAAFTISNAGGDQAHNNLQPYIVQNFIIKAYNNARTLSIVENSLDSDSIKNAASVHSVNNIKSIEIPHTIITKARTTMTPQEFVNLWFGDETHTKDDLVIILNKIFNGNATCYTIPGCIKNSSNQSVIPVSISSYLNGSSYYFNHKYLHIAYLGANGTEVVSQTINLPANETETVTIEGKASAYVSPLDKLTSTSVNWPLSANQGRILNEKIDTIKPIEIPYTVINQSSGSAITPQEFINLWFGDETHTVDDMIEVFNKIHNGNTICYTIQSNISSTVKTILPVNVQIRTLASASSYYFRYNRLQVSWIFPAGNTYYSQIIDLPREETGSVEIYGRESYYIEPYDDLDSTNINKSLSANQGRILNEKITTLTTYSTAEIKTGETWIDGKPIYRKVVEYTPSAIIGELGKVTDIYIPHRISNFKQLCGQKCITSDGYILPSIGSKNEATSDYGACIRAVTSENIALRLINDTWGIRTWYITLEYTKTTD